MKCRTCGRIQPHSTNKENRVKWYNRYYCTKECMKGVCLICGEVHYLGDTRKFCCLTSLKQHPLRNTWDSMLRRCYDPSRNNYKYYGAKGIRVDERWFDFQNFLDDMGDRPDGYSLDKIDNNKNYGSENCRWVTIEEQRVNRGRFKNTKNKYKGVSILDSGNFAASIRHKSKSIYLGSFDTEIEAAKAYNKKIKEFYPENYESYINKIEEV